MANYSHPGSAVDTFGKTGTPYISGESGILAGYYVYQDSADGTVKMAKCNGTLAQANVIGITLNTPTRVGMPVNIAKVGDFQWVGGGFGLGGKLLVLATTSGRARDYADMLAGQWLTIIGWTVSDELWRFQPTAIALPFET